MTASHLYALHDFSEEWAAIIRDAGKTAWSVISESIGDDPADKSGHDYRPMAAYNVTPIVRLNFSHHGYGTLPLPNRYDLFAQRCANFVSASPGCEHWVIGNESNLAGERAAGVPITPRQYADAFAKCRNAIKQRGTQHKVIVAAVAPYNVDTGPWIDYWREMLKAIEVAGGADGLALHFYSRGSDPSSITSDAKMDAPFDKLHNGFRAYRDFLAAVPQSLRGLPAYATETDQLDPWPNINNGWVQNAYADIAQWNADPSHQVIKCLALYRWENFDKWGIKGKDNLMADFRQAVGYGYASPIQGATNAVQTYIPVVSSVNPQTEPSLPPRIWDERLTARGVTIETPPVAPGQEFWRIVKAQWYDLEQARQLGPDHHIMADMLDAAGKRVVDKWLHVEWPTDEHVIQTDAKPGEPYAANYPMSPSRNEFSICVLELTPTETLKGIGMGMETPSGWNSGEHTSTGVVFQLVTMPAATAPAVIGTGPKPPEPPLMPGPKAIPNTTAGANIRSGPGTSHAILGAVANGVPLKVVGRTNDRTWLQVATEWGKGWVSATVVRAVDVEGVPVTTVDALPPPPPPDNSTKWARSIAFVLSEEGGLSTDPNDKGNYVNGVFVGTKYGISAKAHPDVDIVNLSVEEAKDIYYASYWQASGANMLPWPMCLAMMDLAVNGGVGRAQEALAAAGDNFLRYMAWRIDWYTRIDDFKLYGAAWLRRCARLMKEAAR